MRALGFMDFPVFVSLGSRAPQIHYFENKSKEFRHSIMFHGSRVPLAAIELPRHAISFAAGRYRWEIRKWHGSFLGFVFTPPANPKAVIAHKVLQESYR